MSFPSEPESIQSVPEELASLRPFLEIEEEWHADSQRFPDVASVLSAGLTPVFDDGNVRPIWRFTSETPPIGSYPLLTPNAFVGLTIFGRVARAIMVQQGIGHEDVRFAVTSMTRTERYQADLVRDPDQLASPTSTHPTGNAWDIDSSGVYRMEGGVAKPVIDPRRYPGRSYIEAYDGRITKAAYGAAILLHNAGIINLVPERTGTPHSCLHMSVSPRIAYVLGRGGLHPHIVSALSS